MLYINKETVFLCINIQKHLSGDEIVDYHGVFGWRVCSRSGEKTCSFGHFMKIFIHTL